MAKYGMYVKFIAKPGARDALVDLLMKGAEGAEAFAGCELYIVNLSDTEPDAVWVTEVWSSEEDHRASLALEETKASIAQAMPLIAGVESIKVNPVGGKGI